MGRTRSGLLGVQREQEQHRLEKVSRTLPPSHVDDHLQATPAFQQKRPDHELQRVPSQFLRLERNPDGVMRLAVSDHAATYLAQQRAITSRADEGRRPHSARPTCARPSSSTMAAEVASHGWTVSRTMSRPSQSSVRQQRRWTPWPTSHPLGRAVNPSATRGAPPPRHVFWDDPGWRGQSLHHPPPEPTPRQVVSTPCSYRALPTPRSSDWNFVRPDIANLPSARDSWVPGRPGDWYDA